MTPVVPAAGPAAFPHTITEPSSSCYFCDPYGYPYRLDLPIVHVMVCWDHRELNAGPLPGRVLPPGWRPSWKRGVWA